MIYVPGSGYLIHLRTSDRNILMINAKITNQYFKKMNSSKKCTKTSKNKLATLFSIA